MIATIDIDELIQLCQGDSSLIWLLDKLKTTRFRVKYNLLDDLDYFTFPRKYINHKRLEENDDIMDDQNFKREKKLLYKKLTSVQKLLLNFVKLY
jgi:hypothetical protein